MVHITEAQGFYEQNYYSPSKEGFRVFDTSAGRMGIMICFDRHFPESFRSCVLREADIILVPTANVEGEPLEMFERELRVGAFQNNVAIAMCNRTGNEGNVRYCGASILVGPDGEVITKARGKERIITGDCDLQMISALRRQNKFLELYNPDAFQFGSS